VEINFVQNNQNGIFKGLVWGVSADIFSKMEEIMIVSCLWNGVFGWL
jgi:hypothetical protein